MELDPSTLRSPSCFDLLNSYISSFTLFSLCSRSRCDGVRREARNACASPLLKLSTNAFCIGLPGAM